MEKWYQSYKMWIIIVVAFILVVVVPFLINEAYKKETGYITVWNGSEFLSYYGTIIGASATILAFSGTIVFTRRQILFERYIQRETTKWKDIECLFREAIILAEPVYLTTMFYNNIQKKTDDVCLALETYMTRLSESMDRIDITIDENEMSKVNELTKQLKEIADEDMKIAKEYDTLLTNFWLLQSCADKSEEHVLMMIDFTKERDRINLQAKDLREQKYHTLLQTKKKIFTNIFSDIENNSQKILTANDEVINGTQNVSEKCNQ